MEKLLKSCNLACCDFNTRSTDYFLGLASTRNQVPTNEKTISRTETSYLTVILRNQHQNNKQSWNFLHSNILIYDLVHS